MGVIPTNEFLPACPPRSARHFSIAGVFAKIGSSVVGKYTPDAWQPDRWLINSREDIINHMAQDLIEFYGTECFHCKEMDPLVGKLEKEEGIKIEKLEVWHNTDNLNVMRELDKGYCGGVPFFFNKKTGKWICGSTSYEKLKEWALGR